MVKPVAAGIDEEALETENSGARERQNVLLIVRDGSAPTLPSQQSIRPARRKRFSSSAATVVVSGRQFSGMSISVV